MMVRAFDFHKSSSFNLRKIFDITGRHHQSHNPGAEPADEEGSPESPSGSPVAGENMRSGSSSFNNNNAAAPASVPVPVPVPAPATTPTPTPAAEKSPPPPAKAPEKAPPPPAKRSGPPSDMDMMKERFAKLLLGEDMSGGGKGVSSALALSNAITNLAAAVFGEQRKLEPMNPDRKARWKKEIDWLLSVTDYIVEFVACEQTMPDGTMMEVMATRQRGDLLVQIPALKKLDAMLIDCLDKFEGPNEFWYVKNADDSEKNNQRAWWIPTVKVPPDGLSEKSRKWLQNQKDSVNQVLKAALAINAMLLTEMAIPDSYIESLPKNGRSTLGDAIYKCITDDSFDPDEIMSSLDLSSELQVLDLKNKIEASVVIWKRKMNQKESKSSWSSAVSQEKREMFEERAETLLLILKHNFPGLPQSALDISKIEYNKDVGLAVLECYSRVLESLASAVMCRIDDVLYADDMARSKGDPKKKLTISGTRRALDEQSQASKTLLDFMGWNLDQGDDSKKDDDDDYDNDASKPSEGNNMSYVERLGAWGGIKIPTDRD